MTNKDVLDALCGWLGIEADALVASDAAWADRFSHRTATCWRRDAVHESLRVWLGSVLIFRETPQGEAYWVRVQDTLRRSGTRVADVKAAGTGRLLRPFRVARL
jgi:hypothetical protein